MFANRIAALPYLIVSLLVCFLSSTYAADTNGGVSSAVSAAERNDVSAQLYLGTCYYTGKEVSQNYEEAAKWFLKAAERGNVEAQYCLSLCYANGQGVEKNPEEAVRWVRKAADAGHGDAQNTLGLFFSNGSGVKQDNQEAVRMFRLASNSGSIEGRKNLALCYANGLGIAQDFTEAVRLFRSAADAGSADAQYNLGICYVNGTGVDRDRPAGIAWMKQGIQNGYTEGEDGLRVALAEYAREQEFAKWARDKNIAFNGEDGKGRTLPHQAVLDNRVDLLEWLLDKGENINIQDDEGVTPVDLARHENNEDLLAWFRKHDIEPRDVRKEMKWAADMRTAGIDEKDVQDHAVALMCEAAGQGDIKTMKSIFTMGVDVNCTMKDGSTPLHFAVHARNRKSIKWLKRQNANLTAKDSRGFTPVDYAAIRQQSDVRKWLSNQ